MNTGELDETIRFQLGNSCTRIYLVRMLGESTWIWNGYFGCGTAKMFSSRFRSLMFQNSLSSKKKHHLSRAHKKFWIQMQFFNWKCCRKLKFLRCALLFSNCSSFLGLGPFWQLVEFLYRKQSVQGIELSSKRVSVWRITASKNVIACSLAIISATWIVLIRLKKWKTS